MPHGNRITLLLRRTASGPLLLLMLSACPGPAAETAPATLSASPTPSGRAALNASATPSARAIPSATAADPASAVPTASAAAHSTWPAAGEEPEQHAFPELEARLPDEIAGVQTDRYSFSGSALEGGMIDDLFIVWATEADRSPDELRVALAVPALGADLGVIVGIMQLPGLSGEELAAGGLATLPEEMYQFREVAGRRVAIGPTLAVFWENDLLFMAVDITGLGAAGTGDPHAPPLLEQAVAAIP